jgi:photosynthetic reaction center cytochrome c subunit
MTGIILKRTIALLSLVLIFAFLISKQTSANPVLQEHQTVWAAVVKSLTEAQAAQTAEKTTEQEYKNIQVLKGVPAWQLDSMMHLFNGSLGVRCDFCHVRNGDKMEWDKDDKQAKRVARKMIQMTLDLNKNSFNNRPEVSCYTCHQGHEHPANAPTLPVAVVAAAPPVAPPATTPATPGATTPATKPVEPQPTVEQVLQKYVEAVGGKAAIEKVQSRQMKGTYTRQGGTELPYEVLQSKDKWLLTVTTPQGANVRGFNGTSGWSRQGNRQHEMEKAELIMMKDWVEAFDALKIKEPYPRLVFRGKEKIGVNETYVLTGAAPDPPVGSDPTQIDFADYKTVDGVKLPFTVSVYYAEFAFSGTRKFKEIKQNVSIEDATFDMPKQ